MRPVLVDPSTSGPRDWREMLILSGDTALPNLENALVALEYSPEWRGVLASNTLSYCVSTRRPTPWGTKIGHHWTDQDDRLTAGWLQRRGINVVVKTAADAVETIAQKNPYNPLTDYLSEIEWDGIDRVETWLRDYLGVEDSPYVRTVGRCWLISAVARAFKPGCKADCCLILEGPQGRGKSSALKALAGADLFTDYLSGNLSSKEASILCIGVWIIEFSELEGIMHQQSKIETVKAFLSRTDDRYRPHYERHAVSLPRQCVFAATTNRDTYMPDETGNRRFWPVRCHWIYPELLTRDRDQIWAEATILFQSGIPWWLGADMEAEAKYQQQSRYDEHPWQEPIREWLGTKTDTSVREILEQCLRKTPVECSKVDQMQVSKALKALGWDKYRVPGKGDRRYRRYLYDL